MARIHNLSECGESELLQCLEPRDDVLLLEGALSTAADLTQSGSATLTAESGPFVKCERTLRWKPCPTGATEDSPHETEQRFQLEQTIDYQLAVPYWRWLYAIPVRKALPDGVGKGRHPWWATPDRLSARQATLVASVTLLNMVGGMLYGLLSQVLTFVAADLGDGSRSQQTTLLAVVRIGVVVTLLVMVFADRIGRRKVALASFLTAAALTLITALAPSLWAVGALQFFSRNLAIAGLLCADTIAVEEMPPGSRAMVAGLGTLAYGLGAGIIVMTLPLADLGGWGWRLTFVVAGLSLPLIWNVRKHLPESRRFVKLTQDRESVAVAALGAEIAAEPLAPLIASTNPSSAPVSASAGSAPTLGSAPRRGSSTGTSEPGSSPSSGRVNLWRFALVAGIFFLLNVFLAPASQLQNDYLRTEVGFSAVMIMVFVLTTSFPGAIGVLMGGRFADKHGRKITIVPGLVAIGIFNAIFFSVVGVPMWFASLLGSVVGGMAAPALAVIAPELFPTAHRGTVRGAVAAIAVAGSVVGLLVAGSLIDARGYGFTFTLLAITPLLGAVVALALPETRGKELEEINP